jgi:transposase
MEEQLREVIAELRAEIESLRGENERLRRELEAAYRRIAELERAAARQAAPFRRREEKKVPANEKKRPGRKPGHRGVCRARPPQIDREIEVPLEECPHCKGPLSEKAPLVQYIEEIPPLRPEVVRLITWEGRCPQCGEVYSTHPLQTSRAQGAASVQLGPRALSLAAMLNKQLGITMRGTCRVLRGVCGLRTTPGGLAQALARVAGKVEDEYERLLQDLRASPAVFADETSWWVGGPGWWLWAFTTPEQTVYRVDQSRGSQVVKETLGEDFAGMLVSDCLASYDPPPYRKHKCIAHHLRAIKHARDQPDGKESRYLREWELFFKSVMIIYRFRPQMEESFFAERRTALEQWCERLLAQECTQPAEVMVRNRLEKQRPHLLGCLYEPAAEPTNNRAERALRPAVIARKVSCGNKTTAGRHCWEILASLATTCQQRAQDIVEYLSSHITLSPHAG